MTDGVVNTYSYCGFKITTSTDGIYFFCISEPDIEDSIIHFHNQQHAAESEIEEEIDKYLQTTVSFFGIKNK